MNILVINSGSSSIKYQYFASGEELPQVKGLIERIGIEGSKLTHEKINMPKLKLETPIPDHKAGIKLILDLLVHPEHGVISSLAEIHAAGHRVVHGGEDFKSSVILDDHAMHTIEENSALAPLHNPPNLLGIRAVQELLPQIPNVAVFDTAFHGTLPEKAFIYALPYEYYEKYKVRRYGFHGTSHDYVSNEGAKLLGKNREELKIVTCHLGNGVSLCAVDCGKSVDTSLGFGTMCGIPMGTRAGDFDPAIMLYIMEKEGKTAADLKKIIYNESGLKGVSGLTNDMRDVEQKAFVEKDHKAQLALDIYAYAVKKYIGAYAAAMNGLDLVVFAGGVGENGWEMREAVLQNMEFLGIELDVEGNKFKGQKRIITKPHSRTAAAVVPTNEELMIAKDTEKLVQELLGK